MDAPDKPGHDGQGKGRPRSGAGLPQRDDMGALNERYGIPGYYCRFALRKGTVRDHASFAAAGL